MGSGIRAEVSIDAPDGCPVAATSRATGQPSYTVSKSVSPASPETVTEEFMLHSDGGDDHVDDAEAVFTYGDKTVYRFERELGRGCPCERIERHDCPVVDVNTRRGVLALTFHAPDMERLQRVVSGLKDAYPDLNVRRLIRSQARADDHNLVFVDRSSLTERQRDVLETAHEMGYFEYPKRANAGEVADELGVSGSTFAEHLAAAQSKLLSAILDC
ncbi:MAG: helix-turn-helix domain-containing protein [Haloferacaceae archaeon]